jgi:hypothetical protein
MNILSVGSFSNYGISNTCTFRTISMEKLGIVVDRIDTSGCNLNYRISNRIFRHLFPIYLPDIPKINKKIIDFISHKNYEVIWIDKGLIIHKDTLIKIKNISPNTKIVGYSPDLMTVKHNQSKQFLESIKEYDLYVTTKSYAIEEMYKIGFKKVIFQPNSYQDGFHFPREITKEEYERLGGEVGFIGAWEKERAESICYLADNGIKVRVWGDKKWQKYKGVTRNLRIEEKGLFNEDYCLALSAFDISLNFLRKMNLDQQTTRSIEIPACQGFMLAERTYEHQELFEEDKEACYFGSNEELLLKCKYYLSNSEERKRIAAAGHDRCIRSGYSYTKRIKSILSEL